MTNDFLRGFSVAIAALIRDYDQPSLALGIMRKNGINEIDFYRAEIDRLDLIEIQRARLLFEGSVLGNGEKK